MSTRRAVPVLLCCAIIASASYIIVVADTSAIATTPEPEVETEESLELDVEATAVSAASFAIFDIETGVVLASKRAEEKRPIASVTKLFSAAKVLEEVPLEATTEITWSDVETEGRAGSLSAGEQYTNRELLWPLLLESSNDAASALARTNPELIASMNEYAQSRGLLSFNFSDASGLSAQNTASARDLAALTRDLYLSLPHLFDITQLPQYVGKQTGWVNNNPFIHDKDYRGGKHGFTYEAGRTGVFIFKEKLAAENERLLGYIVLGSSDLTADITSLRKEVAESVGSQ